jgi:hypothetical protein
MQAWLLEGGWCMMPHGARTGRQNWVWTWPHSNDLWSSGSVAQRTASYSIENYFERGKYDIVGRFYHVISLFSVKMHGGQTIEYTASLHSPRSIRQLVDTHILKKEGHVMIINESYVGTAAWWITHSLVDFCSTSINSLFFKDTVSKSAMPFSFFPSPSHNYYFYTHYYLGKGSASSVLW